MSHVAHAESRPTEVIATAASEGYRRQLLAFVGSLRSNWSDHPRVIVYDLGLSPETRDLLRDADVTLLEIPPFVPHWRKHYTWKLWCLKHAPGERILWLDAGSCILRPMPEIFEIIGAMGYFCVPNYQPLEVEASPQAREGCGVGADFCRGKSSLAANIFGYQRGTAAAQVVERCLDVAMVERHIQATDPRHRHDQAILSLIMYRDIHPLLLSDGMLYGFDDLHAKFTTHAIWSVRRGMHYQDKQLYAAFLSGPARPHRPRPSHKLAWWYRGAWGAKVLMERAKQVGRAKVAVPDGVKK